MKIGFIGCGKMAGALVDGILRTGVCKPEDVILSGKTGTHLKHFSAKGCKTAGNNPEVVEFSDVIVLAVKPKTAFQVVREVTPFWNCKKLLISICAGLPILGFEDVLGSNARIVRVMPNTCCSVGEGASAYVLSIGAKPQDKEIVESIFGSIGFCYSAESESALHGVTAVAGSGPAYAFVMLDAMISGGVKCGLPVEVARRLAAQTMLGAAKMVLESDEHPGSLRDAVTSPSGTTIAAVQVLEEQGLRGAVMKAMDAAYKRSHELASTSTE